MAVVSILIAPGRIFLSNYMPCEAAVRAGQKHPVDLGLDLER